MLKQALFSVAFTEPPIGRSTEVDSLQLFEHLPASLPSFGNEGGNLGEFTTCFPPKYRHTASHPSPPRNFRLVGLTSSIKRLHVSCWVCHLRIALLLRQHSGWCTPSHVTIKFMMSVARAERRLFNSLDFYEYPVKPRIR